MKLGDTSNSVTLRYGPSSLHRAVSPHVDELMEVNKLMFYDAF